MHSPNTLQLDTSTVFRETLRRNSGRTNHAAYFFIATSRPRCCKFTHQNLKSQSRVSDSAWTKAMGTADMLLWHYMLVPVLPGSLRVLLKSFSGSKFGDRHFQDCCRFKGNITFGLTAELGCTGPLGSLMAHPLSTSFALRHLEPTHSDLIGEMGFHLFLNPANHLSSLPLFLLYTRRILEFFWLSPSHGLQGRSEAVLVK